MGASFAQVQSPQTSGGKGSPMSDGQLPPAPATMDQPQGKGASSGGGIAPMDPSTYDASVLQRRFANNGNDPMSANVSPAVNSSNMQNQGQMPVNPGAMRQGKGAGGMGNDNSATYQFYSRMGAGNQNQETTQNAAIDSTSVNEKKTIFNPGINTFPDPRTQQPQGKGASTNSATSGQPRMGQPNNYTNTVGGWDNASIQPQRSGGKGKGG